MKKMIIRAMVLSAIITLSFNVVLYFSFSIGTGSFDFREWVVDARFFFSFIDIASFAGACLWGSYLASLWGES